MTLPTFNLFGNLPWMILSLKSSVKKGDKIGEIFFNIEIGRLLIVVFLFLKFSIYFDISVMFVSKKTNEFGIL